MHKPPYHITVSLTKSWLQLLSKTIQVAKWFHVTTTFDFLLPSYCLPHWLPQWFWIFSFQKIVWKLLWTLSIFSELYLTSILLIFRLLTAFFFKRKKNFHQQLFHLAAGNWGNGYVFFQLYFHYSASLWCLCSLVGIHRLDCSPSTSYNSQSKC